MAKLTREQLQVRRLRAKRALSAQKKQVLICAGTGCIAGGARDIYHYMQEECARRGLDIHVGLIHEDDHGNDGIHLKGTGCHGFCEMGPLLQIEPQGYLYIHVKQSDCDEIIEKTILGGEVIPRLLYVLDDKTYAKHDEIPFYHKQHRTVLENCGSIDAEDIDEYMGRDGYIAFERALFEIGPEGVCNAMLSSGLRGRGGGGFPAGRKWDSVRKQKETKRYVVCNGDEGDPGAFMDRSIMEGNPHSVVEGMLIAAVAAGSDEGYIAFERALFEIGPEGVCNAMLSSGLRGRGGGGFPAGRKWDSVRKQKETKRYVVCNGDEGDPGAFMDRSIMEGNPHSVVEGMLIAAVAAGSDEGYIYVRAEYPLAVARLKTAIQKAEELGLLGDNILGTDFSFHLHINRGAGAFVCGEGSALTASIEGNRGMPRVKPPRTVEQGLWAKPTVLNNVETFSAVPLIIRHGGEWFRAIGTDKSPGTKAFALTGNVVNTGLIEVPMGTTLRQVIFDIGGGIKDGKKFKAVQIGGPSGGCLTEEHLDIPMDFDSLKKMGAMIGSGGLVVMDEDTCMVEVARFFMNFTQNESCGKCVPCREGTRRMLEILTRIIENKGSLEDLELLEELSATIGETALCGLGQSACKPVQSTLKYFRNEYLAHVVDKHCPHCNPAPKTIQIKAELCKGCTKCAKTCPVEAISGTVKHPHVIDPAKCIKCKACIGACPFKAIVEE